MRRLIVLLAIVMAADAFAGGEFAMNVTLHYGDDGFQSFAYYDFYPDATGADAFSQYHTIVNTSAEHSSELNVSSWSNNLNANETGQPPNCYTGRLTASALSGPFWDKQWHSTSAASEQICFLGPPPPPEPTAGTGGCPTCIDSPIVINAVTGEYKFSGPDDPVLFDINANGLPNRITWTARESGLAFLANDRNGNLRIDDGSELFGNATVLRSGERAANGFEALRELDTNGDCVIDARDVSWPALLLWTDANHDGVSQVGELRNISTSVIRALETDYHATSRRDAHGNVLRYEAMFRLSHGRRPMYDVYLQNIP